LKKKISIFLLIIVVLFTMGAYVMANHGEVTLYADSKPLNRNPEPVLKGNAGILRQNEYRATAESVLDEQVLKERNGVVKLKEYMTYAEFVKMTGNEELSTEIAKDRIVFVVQVYYPDGFEHVRAGFIKNCLATGFYDAETGEYLGGSFETVSE
jgi:hypothetical protein